MSRIGRFVLYGVGFLGVLAAILFLALYIFVTERNQPHPRGPYLQSVTPTSIWVAWKTTSPSIGKVEYGLTPELGMVVEENTAVLQHHVQLTGLKPYTDYYYRVNKGKVAKFRTAADTNHNNFQFAVYGDTRSGETVHRRIAKRIAAFEPDFVIHTGDLVETGRANSEWDRFFKIAEPLLRIAPFYPTLGNHEDFDPKRDNNHYLDIFHLPGNELWYAFDYGNARFICLKADGYPLNEFVPDDEQVLWLEKQLGDNEAPWLVVFFHVGVFTSRSEEILEPGMRERLVPIFEEYGVDLVLMGHHHSYERLLVNGITYIVTAGGGASLYDLNEPEPGSQVAVSAHHFLTIELNGNQLFGVAIDRNGRVIDQFELFSDG
jgi:predicted phosphodiesterase